MNPLPEALGLLALLAATGVIAIAAALIGAHQSRRRAAHLAYRRQVAARHATRAAEINRLEALYRDDTPFDQEAM